VTGTFFRALAVTMSVSLFTSLALALSWTPSLSQYFIGRRKHDEESGTAEETEEASMARLLAAEDASLGGFFRKVVDFLARRLRQALAHPVWLAGLSLLLVAASYVCYRYSGSDLMPEMDEGGFTLDYWTPAGTSLAETDRMVSHMEQILNAVPEVESTSRRTGLELGLAAVTEANRGDILVKLKENRDRNIDDVMEEVRSRVTAQEPAVQVEFIQVLQDMIGDLTSEPEPIQIKLFSPVAARHLDRAWKLFSLDTVHHELASVRIALAV
jgi:multidrug efflux pump subunit AcrB